MVEAMEIQKGFKKTEVGIIPNDWGVTQLGNLFEITSSKRVFQSEWKSNGVPFYRARELAVLGEKGVVDNELFITKEKYDAFRRQHGVPNVGDMLVTGVGTLGKVYVVPDEKEFYFKDGNIIWFKIRDAINSEYLHQLYFTQTIIKQIDDASGKTTVGTYTITGAKKTFIPLPPTKAEQAAIAEALNDADALITQSEKLIAKKKAIKQGAMQELLKQKEGWEVRKLGEIVNIRKGQLITDSSRIDGNIPVIAGGKTPAYYHNKPNRLGKTITVSGSGASAGYVSFHNYPIFASDCSTIEEGKDYSIEFVFFLLQLLQERIYQMQTGGAQPHIHPSDLNPIEVSIPNKEKQTHIANILSDMDNEIQSIEKKLDKYKMLKQGMMQNLLTGRIRLV